MSLKRNPHVAMPKQTHNLVNWLILASLWLFFIALVLFSGPLNPLTLIHGV